MKTMPWPLGRWSGCATAKSAFSRWTTWSAILIWPIELNTSVVRQLAQLDENQVRRISPFILEIGTGNRCEVCR